MNTRIRMIELQARVNFINKRLNRSDVPFSIGNICIDQYSPGDNPYQYKLVEKLENGGIHEWTNYRMTIREFYAYLNGLCDMLDIVSPLNFNKKIAEDLQAKASVK